MAALGKSDAAEQILLPIAGAVADASHILFHSLPHGVCFIPSLTATEIPEKPKWNHRFSPPLTYHLMLSLHTTFNPNSYFLCRGSLNFPPAN